MSAGIERYLVSNEELVSEYPSVCVARGDKSKLIGGFSAYVTNLRLLCIKKNRVHEILNQHVTSIDWETKRRYSPLVPLLGIISFVQGVSLILGIILIFEWLRTCISFKQKFKYDIKTLVLAILAIILAFSAPLGIIPGLISVYLWAKTKVDILVIYGGGEKIKVYSPVKKELDELFTTIRNIQMKRSLLRAPSTP